jgi:glutaconate CoA-transferase, subunit A
VSGDKLVSMQEAVARFVPDGASVCMGTALEGLIPFAAGHELIRQRRQDLTLISPIADMLFDQLIAAGCVGRIQAARVGNGPAGLGHNRRRAAELGMPRPVALEDHSNLSIAAALQAGAMGAPYIPMRPPTGTGLADSNPTFKPARDPFSGDPIVLIPALTPDVAILHVQRSDAEGHAHCWGTLGVTRQAALAAKAVIIVAEEIRPRERILSDPGLVLAPTLKIAAVVHEPFGAYPSLVRGCYERGHDFYHRYQEESRTAEGTRAWLDRWVYGVADWKGFLSALGAAALDAVRVKTPRISDPLDYGA